DDAVDALMKYTGVIRIDSIEQLFELGHGLVTQPLPRGRRVAILSNRGGPAPLAQDACEAAGLKVAKLSEETKESLRDLVPQARYANPFELPAAIEPEAYGKALEILLADPGVDAALVLYIPTVTGRVKPVRTSADTLVSEEDQRSSAAVMVARGVAQQIAQVAQQEGVALPKPVLANFLALPGVPVELRRYRKEVPSFDFPDMAAIVLARMADYYAWKSSEEGEPPEFESVDVKRAAAIIAKALDRADGADEEAEGGIHSVWIGGEEAAELLGCYAIATKEHVEVAGYLSFELSVPIDLSVSHDPIFGPFISMGIAGEISELLGARAMATLPLFTSDIPAFIDSIPAVALINGAAGRKPHDMASLADLIGRIGAMIDDHFAIANLEAGVVSTPSGCYVSSVEVRLADWSPLPMATTRSLT
ncbi:MAG: acetate--CoA ligase family protein, partial [Actinomycetota bacterium]|nr:acetate--CoA ligase family protein [Actinomycetota bacterium]